MYQLDSASKAGSWCERAGFYCSRRESSRGVFTFTVGGTYVCTPTITRRVMPSETVYLNHSQHAFIRQLVEERGIENPSQAVQYCVNQQRQREDL